MLSIKNVTALAAPLALLLLLSSCQNSDEGTSTQAISMQQAISRAAEQFLNNKQFHSVSIALYDNGDSYVEHFGELTIGQGNAPNNHTIYELGSVSKLFTGTLVAKAVMENKLSLDDDVRDYLQGQLDGVGNKLSFDNLSYRGQPVKVGHLVAHTSGFPNIIAGLDSKSTFFKELSKIKIDTVPGEKYSYSNTAPELAAFILEVVYEKNYEVLLSELFNTWGMENTRYRLIAETKEQLIQGYNKDAQLMPNLDSSLWGGAVGLHSTPADLLVFIQSQIESPSPLVLESRRELFSVSKTLGIGYFWQLDKRSKEISYRHHGGIYGMQNWMMIYPEYGVGISVVTNVSFDGVGQRLEELSDKLLTEAIRLKHH